MVLLYEPISYLQAIILGLLQGFAELFPISSLGQSVILPQLFGWNIHQNDHYFLTFLVATHLATAIVLLGFFWQRLGADRPGRLALARRARDRGRESRGQAGLAVDPGHDPGRRPRAAVAGSAAVGVRLGAVGGLLPDP